MRRQKFKNKKFESISFIHIVILILLWSALFWLDWKLIILGIIIYYIQLIFFGNCLLTKIEFKEKEREMTMYAFLLEKAGFNFQRKTIKFLADYIFPYIILFIAIIWQIALKNKVIFSFWLK